MNRYLLIFALLFSALQAEVPKLSVRGDAVLKKPADQAIITIGVVTEAESAQDAMEANSRKMSLVMTSLRDFGLDKSEYQTGRFQVMPQYTPRPDKAPANWKARIEGYQVTHNLTITTTMLKKLGDLLDMVVATGVNSIDDIQFTLKDHHIHRKEAIYQATSAAMQDARNLADAANVHLNQVLLITLDQSNVQPVFYNAAPMMAKGTVIEPGNVDVTATVHITFELTN